MRHQARSQLPPSAPIGPSSSRTALLLRQSQACSSNYLIRSRHSRIRIQLARCMHSTEHGWATHHPGSTVVDDDPAPWEGAHPRALSQNRILSHAALGCGGLRRAPAVRGRRGRCKRSAASSRSGQYAHAKKDRASRGVVQVRSNSYPTEGLRSLRVFSLV